MADLQPDAPVLVVIVLKAHAVRAAVLHASRRRQCMHAPWWAARAPWRCRDTTSAGTAPAPSCRPGRTAVVGVVDGGGSHTVPGMPGSGMYLGSGSTAPRPTVNRLVRV